MIGCSKRNVVARLADAKDKAGETYRTGTILLLCFLLFFLIGCGGQQSTSSLVTQQPPQARLTYVAVGASDTFGIGTHMPKKQSWPTDLAGRLGNGVHLINLGVPGIDVHQALNVELPIVLDTHPDLITVWLAVNDLVDKVQLDSYSHDLNLLLSRLQAAAPHARIVVANVPDLTHLAYFHSYNPQTLQTLIFAYNAAITLIVKHHYVLLVDLYLHRSELTNHPEYISADGLHPNALGYARIADIFYHALQNPAQ